MNRQPRMPRPTSMPTRARAGVVVAVLACLPGLMGPSRAAERGADTFTDAILPLLRDHCLACHSAEKQAGELDLERFTDIGAVRADAATWQHVLEPLGGYLRLAEYIFAQPESAQDFNFGPDPSNVAMVKEVVTQAQTSFGGGNIEWGSVPDGLHEAQTLTLDNTKAKRLLGIHPVWNLETAVDRTMNWYRLQNSGHSAVDLCEQDIQAYLGAI